MAFTSANLTDSQLKAMKKEGWDKQAPIALSRLKYLTLSYIDFEGKEHQDGEMIVFDVIAPSVLAVFKQLHRERFPINSIQLMSEFNNDDERSMEANNSSAFNVRAIAGTKTVSIHSYGLAIDINPKENPYLMMNLKNGRAQIHPVAGALFLNRAHDFPGKVDSIVPLMRDNGFCIWGGFWREPLDYHHFQPPRLIAQLLALMPLEEGKELWNMLCKAPDFFCTLDQHPQKELWINAYIHHPEKYLSRLEIVLSSAENEPISALYQHLLGA